MRRSRTGRSPARRAERRGHRRRPDSGAPFAHARAGGADRRRCRPPQRGPREGFEGSAWFRLNVGRRQNADPRWILPLLCRRGHVSRSEIGAIRMAPTRRCSKSPARRRPFLAAVQRTATEDDDVEIVPVDGKPRDEVRIARPANRAPPVRPPARTARWRTSGTSALCQSGRQAGTPAGKPSPRKPPRSRFGRKTPAPFRGPACWQTRTPLRCQARRKPVRRHDGSPIAVAAPGPSAGKKGGWHKGPGKGPGSPVIRILVDADACPVKEEIYKVAFRHAVPVTIVSNSPIRVPAHELIDRLSSATASMLPTTGSRNGPGRCHLRHWRYPAGRPLPEGGRDRDCVHRQVLHRKLDRQCDRHAGDHG